MVKQEVADYEDGSWGGEEAEHGNHCFILFGLFPCASEDPVILWTRPLDLPSVCRPSSVSYDLFAFTDTVPDFTMIKQEMADMDDEATDQVLCHFHVFTFFSGPVFFGMNF